MKEKDSLLIKWNLLHTCSIPALPKYAILTTLISKSGFIPKK